MFRDTPDFSGDYETCQKHVAPELHKMGFEWYLTDNGWICFVIQDESPTKYEGSTVMEAGCKALVELKK